MSVLTGMTATCGEYSQCFWSICTSWSDAGTALPRFTPSTITIAFCNPPFVETSSCSDSRAVVPHTCGSFLISRFGSFGMAPETEITPEIEPPSLTWTTSYPGIGEGAAVDAGGGAVG